MFLLFLFLNILLIGLCSSEFSVLYTFYRNKAVGKLYQNGRLPFHSDNLHAQIMLQMKVQRRQNIVMISVLDVGKFIYQFPSMVVKH